MSETIWQRSDDWVSTEVEDSMVMLNIESGKYVSLNRTADAVWQALDEPRDAATICAIVREQFEVSGEDCAAAVSRALDEMQRLDLAASR